MASEEHPPTVIASVDFSDHGERILKEGLLLARAAHQSLHVLHVAAGEPVFVGYDKEEVNPFTRSARAGELTDEHRRVRELAEALTDTTGVEVHPMVIMGPTAEMLLSAIDELNASHIVMGTHGHGGAHHLMFGSVAEEVVRRSPVPVLLVPVTKR
jgi:nucleotide-binding universal stress UspA family protein